MTTHRLFSPAAALLMLSAAAGPLTLRAQGDSLRVSDRSVAEARRLGYRLFVPLLWRWVERVTVIDMMPQPQSNETSHDGEPNLAVNPSAPTRIVGSAFTSSPSGATNLAPVYVSTNGGTTWALREIVPSGNGMTGDISEKFALRGNTLYTGILRGGSWLRQVILRSADPFAGGAMTTLVDDSTVSKDQPYVAASTAGTPDRDRVYVGYNFYGLRTASGGTGRTASVHLSLDARTAAAPAGFGTHVIEARNTFQQDMPAIRTAVHAGGTVYSIFYRWTAGNAPNTVCDVIVVRDSAWGAGASPFTALTDPSDAVAGRIVATGRTVPPFSASLGQNRLVASNLSIAVNPADARDVWVAWADSNATSRYTLHVRRSTDSGATWSGDLLTIATATNPALAINSNGMVGFLYQQLNGAAQNQRWGTHLRRTSNGGTSWADMVLANVPNGTGFMGDYLDLAAVGRTFYGVFPALNTPDAANFPQGVIFQRNADFGTHQLRNLGNTANVAASIDPFFFKIEPPTVVDICHLVPRLCTRPELEPGRIIIPVDTMFPIRVVDPIPRNCTIKWRCPGCEGALCPGWYHIFLDDLDPAVWRVQVAGRLGETIHQQIRRAGSGVVISFRPNRGNFRAKEVGDYSLTFESLKRLKPGKYTFATRLEVSRSSSCARPGSRVDTSTGHRRRHGCGPDA